MADPVEERGKEDQIDTNAWRPQRHRIRRVVFTAKDEAVLAEALRDSFPTVKFLQEEDWVDLPFYPEGYGSLAHVPGGYAIIVVPPTAEWRPIGEFDARSGAWRGYRNVPRHGYLRYDKPEWDWSFFGSSRISYDPPTLNEGRIYNSYEPWNPDHRNFLALVRKTWRIISRIATNRYKRGHPLGNQLMGCEHQLMKDAKAGDLWIGHHALEWSRRNPRRMLNGSFRACDDWEVPQNAWYRSLRQRVDGRYGLAFGEPPTEPPRRTWQSPVSAT